MQSKLTILRIFDHFRRKVDVKMMSFDVNVCAISINIHLTHKQTSDIDINHHKKKIAKWYCGHLHDKNCRFCAFSIIFDFKLTSIDVNMCAISENIQMGH